MSSKLDWNLDTLFLYLANATLCLSHNEKTQVFNDMAYKLMEWNNTSRCELRELFDKYGLEFIDLCARCNEELYGRRDVEEPLCEQCIKE